MFQKKSFLTFCISLYFYIERLVSYHTTIWNYIICRHLPSSLQHKKNMFYYSELNEIQAADLFYFAVISTLTNLLLLQLQSYLKPSEYKNQPILFYYPSNALTGNTLESRAPSLTAILLNTSFISSTLSAPWTSCLFANIKTGTPSTASFVIIFSIVVYEHPIIRYWLCSITKCISTFV